MAEFDLRNDMTRLQEEIYDWAVETFGDERLAEISMIKLEEEVKELRRDFLNTGAATAGEIADGLILLLDIAARSGIDAYTAVVEKMAINRKRLWIRRPDGTFQHTSDKVQCALRHEHDTFEQARACNRR